MRKGGYVRVGHEDEIRKMRSMRRRRRRRRKIECGKARRVEYTAVVLMDDYDDDDGGIVIDK